VPILVLGVATGWVAYLLVDHRDKASWHAPRRRLADPNPRSQTVAPGVPRKPPAGMGRPLRPYPNKAPKALDSLTKAVRTWTRGLGCGTGRSAEAMSICRAERPGDHETGGVERPSFLRHDYSS